MTDRYSYNTDCPQCGAKGEIAIVDEEVTALTPGIVIVYPRGFSDDKTRVFCSKCHVELRRVPGWDRMRSP